MTAQEGAQWTCGRDGLRPEPLNAAEIRGLVKTMDIYKSDELVARMLATIEAGHAHRPTLTAVIRSAIEGGGLGSTPLGIADAVREHFDVRPLAVATVPPCPETP